MRSNVKSREQVPVSGTPMTRDSSGGEASLLERSALVPIESDFGLVLPDNLSFSEWMDRGRALVNRFDNVRLQIGDLVLYGERHFPEEFKKLENEYAYNKNYIRKSVDICKAISYERRAENHEIWKHLSFSHLDAVHSLPEKEQDDLLRKAAMQRWNRERLREEVNTRFPDRRWTKVARVTSEIDRSNLVEAEKRSQPSLTLVKADEARTQTEVLPEPTLAPEPEPVTIIVPAGRPAETEEAAQYLLALSRSAQSKKLRDSLKVILEERDRFIAIVNAAKSAVMKEQITNELVTVVSERVDPTYGKLIELLTAATPDGMTDSELDAAGVTRAATAAALRSGVVVHKPVGRDSTWRWLLSA